MPLLKNNVIVPDTWVQAADDMAIAPDTDVVVSFARLLKEWESLSKHQGRLGVVFGNADRAEALSLFLPKVSLIILPFPAFVDGRAYSIARQIREFGYRGELRATGNVLPDQLQFMIQVGFDAFEISDRFPLAQWQQGAKQMSLAYQRGLFRRGAEAEVWTERHADAEPWLEQPHAG